jgi:Ser/Thr protein kinase RdoA (MazF antagonist)
MESRLPCGGSGWFAPAVTRALATDAGELFGLDGQSPSRLTAVARGAMGQVWLLELGAERYALKMLFAAPDAEEIRHEVSFTAHLAAAGVPVPASVPAADGRILVTRPGGGWLRLYRWVDGSKADLADAGLPPLVGALLGRLHANALPPWSGAHSWYQSTPDPSEWPRLAAAARKQDVGWAQRFADAVARIPRIAELVTPMDPDRLVTCHCDLHPDNVLVTAGGELVPLDWDNVGPADPDRELAKLLFDWFVVNGRPDRRAVPEVVDAYRAAGGPGRLPDARAFGMAIAADLNFLRRQATMALAPDTPPEHRQHAIMEIDESLARLPTPDLLAELIELSR